MNNSLAKQGFHWFAVCGLLLFAFCACSPAGDPSLIGKWKVKGGEQVMEIRRDGSWVEEADKDAQVISAKWEWVATNRIRLTLKSKLIGNASGEMEVSLNGDTLVLKDDGGATEYTRVR
jgi:hypothetical protein